jgi:hypothetical protein
MTRSCIRHDREGHTKEFAVPGVGMKFASGQLRHRQDACSSLPDFHTASTASVARRAPAIWYLQPKEGKESMFNPVILIAFSALILYFVLENLASANEGQHSRC